MKTQFYMENLFLTLKEVHVLFGGIWCHDYQMESTQKPDKQYAVYLLWKEGNPYSKIRE